MGLPVSRRLTRPDDRLRASARLGMKCVDVYVVFNGIDGSRDPRTAGLRFRTGTRLRRDRRIRVYGLAREEAELAEKVHLVEE